MPMPVADREKNWRRVCKTDQVDGVIFVNSPQRQADEAMISMIRENEYSFAKPVDNGTLDCPCIDP
jgi:hypothetical protein